MNRYFAESSFCRVGNRKPLLLRVPAEDCSLQPRVSETDWIMFGPSGKYSLRQMLIFPKQRHSTLFPKGVSSHSAHCEARAALSVQASFVKRRNKGTYGLVMKEADSLSSIAEYRWNPLAAASTTRSAVTSTLIASCSNAAGAERSPSISFLSTSGIACMNGVARLAGWNAELCVKFSSTS